MAGKDIVIIHGWSDDSESFEKLAKRLEKETGLSAQQIWLGDYVSLDDDVRITDIATALEAAWSDRGLPAEPNSMDVIIHSTGGLVIREWMDAFYMAKGQRPPVQNLVMLAPANFGSPLAHKGRSLIGRVFKGSGSEKRFQTGTHILKSLEMASPYTWDLAERDRFEPNVFSKGGVRCTVIVGNTGYSGIKGIANEDGSDGTVYVATANLNCARVEIEVSRETKGEDLVSLKSQKLSVGKTAFLVLDGYDHGQVTGKDRLTQKLLQPILRGLSVKANEFTQWCADCEQKTRAVEERYFKTRDADQHAFQNTVFRIRDDHGNFVDDYTVEFYGDFEDDGDFWARVFNREVSGKTHPCEDNTAYRSFMIDVTRLDRELDKVDEELRISFSALPDVMDEGTLVGYRTTGVKDIGELRLNREAALKFFKPSRTLLVDIVLPRYQREKVFRLNRLEN